MAVAPGGLEIRAALPNEEANDEANEEARALALVHNPPGPEATGLVGSEEAAIAFGESLQALGQYRSPGDHLVVAVCAGEPVGVLIANRGRAGGEGVHWTRIPLLLVAVVRIVSLRGLAGFIRRGLLRLRIDLPIPEGSLHISELHVRPDFQGRGIGGALLAHAEEIARKQELARLSLTTLATNPARRLYARSGYAVTAESNVPGYEKFTGATGRVLMEKRL